jgi:hypothetical protein
MQVTVMEADEINGTPMVPEASPSPTTQHQAPPKMYGIPLEFHASQNINMAHQIVKAAQQLAAEQARAARTMSESEGCPSSPTGTPSNAVHNNASSLPTVMALPTTMAMPAPFVMPKTPVPFPVVMPDEGVTHDSLCTGLGDAAVAMMDDGHIDEMLGTAADHKLMAGDEAEEGVLQQLGYWLDEGGLVDAAGNGSRQPNEAYAFMPEQEVLGSLDFSMDGEDVVFD